MAAAAVPLTSRRPPNRREVWDVVITYVFLFSVPLIHSLTPDSPHSVFTSCQVLRSRRPLAALPGEVNWLRCVFRLLGNDNSSGMAEGDYFLNFLQIGTCLPSADIR